MTVIAFRAGILAGDRLSTQSDVREGERTKIGRLLAAPSIRFAQCGSCAGSAEILAWIEGGFVGPQPSREEGGTVILIDAAIRPVVFTGGKRWLTPEAEFFAWGSGWKFALGAMAQGAGAVEACQAAKRFDVYCGGEVEQLSPNRTGA